MMNSNTSYDYDITSTYQEVLAILDAINADYESFDASTFIDNFGHKCNSDPCIYVQLKNLEVIFEFDHQGNNGYYYYRNRI